MQHAPSGRPTSADLADPCVRDGVDQDRSAGRHGPVIPAMLAVLHFGAPRARCKALRAAFGDPAILGS
eukprot:11179403-Alexandrium_andersonii.AAC.1